MAARLLQLLRLMLRSLVLLRELFDELLVDFERGLVILCAQVLLDLLRVAVGRILPDIR